MPGGNAQLYLSHTVRSIRQWPSGLTVHSIKVHTVKQHVKTAQVGCQLSLDTALVYTEVSMHAVSVQV